jgi:hypothetical protein
MGAVKRALLHEAAERRVSPFNMLINMLRPWS